MKKTTENALNTANSINQFFEKLNPAYSWVVLFLYIAAMAMVSVFHEPWFDEAQSWLIARDASIRDILFYIPHYEGHPPLWHLYLALFAKTGVPYELGIKFAVMPLNAIAMGLVLFKAPFPKIYRFAIPFTFYFFFQYGVLSRCYSFLVLGMVLAGLTYAQRNSRPFRFVLSLILVCCASAFGIIFAGGIALVWVIDSLVSKNYPKSLKAFFGDQRVYALLMLLITALLLGYLILPRSDTFGMNIREGQLSFIGRLFFMLIVAPMEALFLRSFTGRYFLQELPLTPLMMGVLLVPFLFFARTIFPYAVKTRGFKLLIIPYVPFAVFCAGLYFSSHHIGVISAFFLFWFIAVQSKETAQPIERAISDRKWRLGINILVALSLCMSVYWSVSASITDIKTAYSPSRQVVSFIKTHQLEDKLLMAAWYPSYEENGVLPNPDHQFVPEYNAYFDENIFYSFNGGDPALTYDTHKTVSPEEIQATYDAWASFGAPDVLFGVVALDEVFGDSVTMADYSLVAAIPCAQIVKDYVYTPLTLYNIYMRNDLLATYGLSPIPEVDSDTNSSESLGEVIP